MPYYSNTLRDLIKRPPSNSELLPIYTQVLDSVESAHLLGVCHRDIKPENLLYDPARNGVALADFGIARFTEDELLTTVETGPSERLANFAYAAPEQRIAGRPVSQTADIYALGLMLNEMFTGEIPQGTGFKKIQEAAPDFGYLDQLVELMVQQQPEQRIQSIAQIKKELIGRGNDFVNLQKLDRLAKEVVPEFQLIDPIVTDPIRIVEKLDWSNNTLKLRLNQPVNPIWEQCFRIKATSYSANFSSSNIGFNGDKVFIRVDEHFLQHGLHYLKQYIPAANEAYAGQIRKKHLDEIASRNAELKARVREQEARTRVLQNIQI